MSPPPDNGPALGQWFNREVVALAPRLRAFLRSRFGPEIDVDDVVQETLLQLWRTANGPGIRAPKAILFVAARNVALDQVRRYRASRLVDISAEYAAEIADDRPDVRDLIQLKQRIAQVDRAQETLPPRARQVFALRRTEGLRHREIAEQLGISCKTVEVHLQRALRHCAELVAAEG